MKDQGQNNLVMRQKIKNKRRDPVADPNYQSPWLGSHIFSILLIILVLTSVFCGLTISGYLG